MKPKKKRRWLWIAAVIVIVSVISANYEPQPKFDEKENHNAVLETENSNELTDAEWEQVQVIFSEYVGKEIEYRPVYCGEWREGKQYKTENYAYGQYLINMDTDGYVHLVVWVQDKKGAEGREVVYNRLDAEQ